MPPRLDLCAKRLRERSKLRRIVSMLRLGSLLILRLCGSDSSPPIATVAVDELRSDSWKSLLILASLFRSLAKQDARILTSASTVSFETVAKCLDMSSIGGRCDAMMEPYE